MIENAPPHPGIEALIFPLLISMSLGVVAYLLAKEKGRNVVLWTIVGSIPFLNFAAMWFFIGSTNLKLEKKLDTIIEELKNKN